MNIGLIKVFNKAENIEGAMSPWKPIRVQKTTSMKTKIVFTAREPLQKIHRKSLEEDEMVDIHFPPTNFIYLRRQSPNTEISTIPLD